MLFIVLLPVDRDDLGIIWYIFGVGPVLIDGGLPICLHNQIKVRIDTTNKTKTDN